MNHNIQNAIIKKLDAKTLCNYLTVSKYHNKLSQPYFDKVVSATIIIQRYNRKYIEQVKKVRLKELYFKILVHRNLIELMKGMGGITYSV